MIDSTDETIRRYLTNDLAEDERDAFEALLLDDPELLEAVIAERSLRAGFRAFGEEAAPAKSTAPTSFWQQIRSYIEAPAWSYGATAFAAVLAVVALLPGPPPSQSEGGLVVGQIVFVSPTRSGETIVNLKAGQSSLLAIDGIKFESSGKADIQVLSDGRTIEAFPSVQLSDELQFNIVLPDLGAGMYTLIVDGTDVEERYQLNVAPEV